jgi:hypothetical protein
MKYMMMMHAPGGTGDYKINDWSPDDFQAHMRFMHDFNKELMEATGWMGRGSPRPARPGWCARARTARR